MSTAPEHRNRRASNLNEQSNAIKFSRLDCCVRCSLTLTSDYAEFSVVDCGRGFSPEFVRHSLYVPFSQQNSTDEGIGLGMSLIKQNVEELEGTIQIDSEQTLGTTVTVSLPLQQLTQGIEQQPENDHQGRGGTAIIPPLPDLDESDLPELKACIYAPSSWMSRYDERDKRSIVLLRESIRHTLGVWFQPLLSVWQEAERGEEDQELPDLILVIQHDLERFRESSGRKFSNVKTVVICADVGKNSESDHGKAGTASSVADAIITGAIIPSKLWETVTLLFPHVVPGYADIVKKSLRDLRIQELGEQNRVKNSLSATEEEKLDRRSARKDIPDDNGPRIRNTHPSHSKKHSLVARYTPPRESPPRPIDIFAQQQMHAPQRILLVDDNAVNLKMLGAFLKKSGVPMADQRSATGGQEAIDACDLALQHGGGPYFDIIFMDLSMPEVSGFDATAAIRRMENLTSNERAYIVALSGLVSDKDRDAAFAAGVDDFITKPAGVQNVKGAVTTWESNSRYASRGRSSEL